MATYYIDPAGNDGTGNGSIGNPWKSLFKACNSVSGNGDIIHVNAGTYTETSRSLLSVNVSIEGEGTGSSTIKHHYANLAGYEAGLLIEYGTNTAQHVSGITFDGDTYQGYQGIAVYQRSNVSIYNCIVRNFYIKGILFGSGASNLSYNNTLHDCQIINSGSQGPNGNSHFPNLYLSRQVNFRCYNNIITQTGRSVNQNGNGVSGYEACYGMKFYNNTITIAPYLYDYIWKFAIELWYQQGLEMYGNTIKGEVDFGKDLLKGSYDYGLYFHNNTVGWDSLVTHRSNGIQLEQTIEDTIICRNTFKNLDNAVWMTQYNYSDDYVENLSIHTNLIYNCGVEGSTSGVPAIFFESGTQIRPRYYNNVQIYNNTIVAHTDHPSAYGIELPTHASEGAPAYIDVRNNIIVGFGTAGVIARQQNGSFTPAIDHLTLLKNVIYDCGNSNNYVTSGVTLTNYNGDTPIKSDPLFAYSPTDLHLSSSSSSAYRVGQDVGLLTDYDNKPWNSTPSVGAYEYGQVGPKTLKGSTSLTFSCRAGIPDLTLECVPDRDDFTLQDVVRVVQPSEATLQGCFDAAIAEYFDPLYEGDHDRLSNFRNYCVRRTYLQAAGSTSLTFDCEATGVPEKYLYGSTSLTFGCTATGEVTAGQICVPTGVGAIYNWYAATYSEGGASIAPAGWHVPTYEEIGTLADYLNNNGYSPAVKAVASTTLWTYPGEYMQGTPGYEPENNNSSDFSLFPYGYRDENGAFIGVNDVGKLILSSIYEEGWARNASVHYDSFMLMAADEELYCVGGSIRLIKDDSTDPGTMTDYDGYVYETVKIGDQVWMKTNLTVGHFNNGTIIPIVEDDEDWAAMTSEAMCYYDNDKTKALTCGNDLAHGTTSLTFGCSGTLTNKTSTFNIKYGALYNWYAIAYNIGGASILPVGWHIPTYTEWYELGELYGGYLVAGSALKETGLSHWISGNSDATNESGLSIIGTGYRSTGGQFAYFGEQGLCQCITDYIPGFNRMTLVYNNNSEYYVSAGFKYFGVAVRAVKDTTSLSEGEHGTIIDFNGHTYPTVCTNGKEWTTKNLVVLHYNDGTPIPNVTEDAAWAALTTGAYCWYGNDPSNGYEGEEVPQIRTASGSTSLTFTLSGKTPPASYPAELHAVQLGAGLHINVDWEAVTDATGYLLQRIPQNYNGVWIPNWKSIYSGSNLTFADHIEDEGVMVDDTHVTYRIFAYNDSGNGPMSPEYIAHWYA